MTTATFDNVTKILNAAKKEPVGVWLIEKSLKIIPMSATKRFNSMVNDCFREFVGCYNSEATVAMIKQDLG